MKAPTVDNLYSVQYARATATATARDLEVSRIHAYQASIINITDGLFDVDGLVDELTDGLTEEDFELLCEAAVVNALKSHEEAEVPSFT